MPLPPSHLHTQIKLGFIKVGRHSPPEHRFWSRVDMDGPIHPVLKTRCWTWTAAKTKAGYGLLYVVDDTVYVHRYSWMLHRPEDPTGLCVLHKCDNPPCVNPFHLFLGTDADNVHDCIAKKRNVPFTKETMADNRGERCGTSKLTDEIVLWIRKVCTPRKHHTGLNCRDLARKFGVTFVTIQNIVNGKTWKHLLLPDNQQ